VLLISKYDYIVMLISSNKANEFEWRSPMAVALNDIKVRE